MTAWAASGCSSASSGSSDDVHAARARTAAAVVAGRAWERGMMCSAPLEDHDGDVPAGLGLVLVVGRPLTSHDGPQFGLLLRRRRTRCRFEYLSLDLDGDRRVRLQVQIPRRVL